MHNSLPWYRTLGTSLCAVSFSEMPKIVIYYPLLSFVTLFLYMIPITLVENDRTINIYGIDYHWLALKCLIIPLPLSLFRWCCVPIFCYLVIFTYDMTSFFSKISLVLIIFLRAIFLTSVPVTYTCFEVTPFPFLRLG